MARLSRSESPGRRVLASLAGLVLFSSVEGQSWSLAASGDVLGNVVPTDDPTTSAVWDLVREADFGFFNLEGQLFNSQNFTGFATSENGGDNSYGGPGGGPVYDPVAGLRLREHGFNLASFANNHAWDYDVAGMEATHQSLDAAGITFSGAGYSLSEARAPAFREEGQARISLISVAGTHTPQSVAGPGSGTIRPRPGLNVLRARPVTRVNATVFQHLKEVARANGQDASTMPDGATEFDLYAGQHPVQWSKWRLAEDTGLDWDINADDFRGIVASVRAAKANSDATILSIHAHESDNGSPDVSIPLPIAATVPAMYIQNVSRSAIDAGADVVVIHGPHHLRGIEIYQGRPIFYSLSSLTYNLGLHFRGYNLPIEWDDGMIATTHFEDGVLSEISLHPIVHWQLHNNTQLPDRMMPKLAPEPNAGRILEHLQKVSDPFGTVIKIKDSVGYVRLQKKPGCVKRH